MSGGVDIRKTTGDVLFERCSWFCIRFVVPVSKKYTKSQGLDLQIGGHNNEIDWRWGGGKPK